MRVYSRQLLILSVLTLAVAASATAQVDRSSLTGVVKDPQGSRVPGAVISVLQTKTGLLRQTTTAAKGTYLVDDIPIGTYTVTISKAGFQNFVANQVQQQIGVTRILDATLNLASGSANSTTVTEPLIQLDRSSATVGAAIENTQVQELPINGRNWARLTALVPGAIDNGPGDQRNIRFAGHGLDDNNITLDGVDATAVYNQEQRQYVRLNIPLGSINEFQVQSQNFGADVEGGTAGGQVSVASPSGTNAFHGEAFEFFRNDYLEARAFNNGASPNPFLLNQFGGSLGGPIVKEKTFFYLDYEGIRQRLGQPQIGVVPSPAFRTSVLNTSPALAQILSAYPAGTSLTANPNIYNYVAELNNVDNEDSGMVRIDQHFSRNTTGFVRYNQDEAIGQNLTGNLNATALADTKFKNGVAELLHVFSPTLVNEAKLGMNLQMYHTGNQTLVPISVSVPGFSTLTASNTSDAYAKTISLIDNVSWQKGRHSLKFGYETRWIFLNQGNSPTGSLTYVSPGGAGRAQNNFLNNIVDSATYVSLTPLLRLRKAQYWGYAQDEWKVSESLTLNLGLRYNFFNRFHEVANRAVPFDFQTCGPRGFCPNNAEFSKPRYNDFDPRVALAWAHSGTVFRAGFGLYHDDGQEDDQNLPLANDVSRYNLTRGTLLPNLSYPITPFLSLMQGVLSPRDNYRLRKDFYVSAWTASVQQSMPGGMLGTVSYLGNKGTDILTTTYINVISPATGTRSYPAFGAISWRGNDSNSSFEGLNAGLRRPFANGLLLSFNYMWSHSINDDGIGGGESDTPQDVLCRACERSSADFDVRQVFNMSVAYQLPFGAGKRYLSSPGILRSALGNWEMTGIGSSRTGLPVNVTVDRSNSSVPYGFSVGGEERPNLIPGVSLSPAGGRTPSNWINLAAFSAPLPGTFGNAGRNIARGPSLWQADLGLTKSVTITERLAVQLRADAFNVFNRAQYGQPLSDISSPGNFGQIVSAINTIGTGSGTPREFQLSVRLLF